MQVVTLHVYELILARFFPVERAQCKHNMKHESVQVFHLNGPREDKHNGIHVFQKVMQYLAIAYLAICLFTIPVHSVGSCAFGIIIVHDLDMFLTGRETVRQP